MSVLDTFRASDGYRWYYRFWRPAGRPRAHLVWLHGIQSHGGWYAGSCEFFARRGYAVSFLDRRGCGLNTAARGDAPSFRRLLDDVAEYLAAARAPASALAVVPTAVLGISWGGKLAVGAAYRRPGLADAVGLLCPGFFARVAPRLNERIALGVARLFDPKRPFPIPLNDPELFTQTPHWLDYLRRDPLSLHAATARQLVNSVQLDVYLRRAAQGVTVPTLLMLAGKDRIIHNRKTRRYVEGFPAADKRVVEHADAHHTLEFEPDPSAWRGNLLEWLGSVVRGNADRVAAASGRGGVELMRNTDKW